MNSEYNERYKNTLPSEGVFTDTLKLDLEELGVLKDPSVVTVSYIDSIPAEISIGSKKYLIGNVKFDVDDSYTQILNTDDIVIIMGE